MCIRLCFKSFRKLLLTVVNQYKNLIRILHLRIVGWLRQPNNANAAFLYSIVPEGFREPVFQKSLYKTQNTIFFHTMTVFFSLHIAREGWEEKYDLKIHFWVEARSKNYVKISLLQCTFFLFSFYWATPCVFVFKVFKQCKYDL